MKGGILKPGVDMEMGWRSWATLHAYFVTIIVTLSIELGLKYFPNIKIAGSLTSMLSAIKSKRWTWSEMCIQRTCPCYSIAIIKSAYLESAHISCKLISWLVMLASEESTTIKMYTVQQGFIVVYLNLHVIIV